MNKCLSATTTFVNNILAKDNNFKILLNTLPDLIWLKDPDGIYLYCNHEFELFFGATEAEIVGKTDFDFVDATLAQFFRDNDLKALNCDKATVNEEWVSYAAIKKNVYLKTTKTPMYSADGKLIGVLGIGHDITHLKETEGNLRFANNQLSKIACTDGLTNIPNRRAFDKHLNQQWNFCKREQVPLALLLIDVDFFKEYNDHYGHIYGDRCLKDLGKLLSNGGYANRPNDFSARFGGEEFAVILSATNLQYAYEIAENIRNDVFNLCLAHEASKVTQLSQKNITVSIGVAAVTPKEKNDELTLLHLADTALYQAKAQGRNISIKQDCQ
ncbi:sensor domain-containing diguanylate cyclase [Litorilituus sediminis]|uniref:diguanylate cyclase n=1 Tax=Litorilituus sediminis TaxID=718192 RepID=A0A4P6P661_9GAMM|nr:GGDEF domain-containing protein [Litorilituus sediminis]QBG35659.1 GGDEF domain-containing protein [Litorilituus sediminis]